MAKKERLGSDPFKESSLNWIQDTREEKKDSKELKEQKTKEPKPQSVLTSDKDKKAEHKKRHTIYLSSNQSKKLKVYAAENNMQLSEIVEKLISENI